MDFCRFSQGLENFECTAHTFFHQKLYNGWKLFCIHRSIALFGLVAMMVYRKRFFRLPEFYLDLMLHKSPFICDDPPNGVINSEKERDKSRRIV